MKKHSFMAWILTGTMVISGSASFTALAESDGGDPVELTVSHYYLEDDRGSNAVADSYLHCVEEYEETHPNVKITTESMAQADYSTKIQAQAAVNELPDVFMVKGSWMENFVSNDCLASVDDYLSDYEYKDTFKEGAFDAATVDGVKYGVPNQMTISSVVYYNADLWKQAGYDSFPTTYEGIMEAADKFNEMGIIPIALGNADQWPAESCILSTLGGRYTGVDWTNKIIAKDDTASFSDDGFVSALDQLAKLSEAGCFNPDMNTVDETQAVNYYCTGKAATVISGHWTVASISSMASEDIINNTKVAVLPTIDESEPDSVSGGCGWYFAVNGELEGEKLQAALEFMFATTGYDMYQYYTGTYGLPSPSVIDGIDLSNYSQLTQDFIALTDSLSLIPVYDLRMDGSVIEVMNSGLQELLNGSVTAVDLAANIQAAQDALQ